MSGWTHQIPAQGSTAALVATFRNSIATAGKCELYGFRPAGILRFQRRHAVGPSGARCGTIGASRHEDPVCRVHRSRSAGLRKRHGNSLDRPLGGFGAVPGVLPSMSRACIRLREIPDRGDPWRSHRRWSQAATPPRARVGQPALPFGAHSPTADLSGQFRMSTSMPAEEVAVVRGTHWK